MKQFTAKIELIKIPSINTAYNIGRSRDGKSWMYLNPEVKSMQDKIKLDLIKQGIKDWSESLSEESVISIDIIYAIKDNFWKRDTSNCTKHIEDAISMASNINDSRNMIVKAEKVFNDLYDNEFIFIVLTPTEKSKWKYKWSEMC